MIGCLRTGVRKQPIIVLYFEFEFAQTQRSSPTELEFVLKKFYNLGAWFCDTVLCVSCQL